MTTKCCERDHNSDGNCDRHSAPGVLRNAEMQQVEETERRDFQKVAQGYELILEGLGLEWKSNPHLSGTPQRAAKALFYELCAGLTGPPPKMTAFPCEGDRGMVISRSIPVNSFCAHHFLPFVGQATVAYIPRNQVLGLSKLSRAVEFVSRRPQVQEDLTVGIADFLSSILGFADGDPWDSVAGVHLEGWGIGVVIKARHLCMEHRGVGHVSDVVTSCLRGEFNKPEVRSEFLSLAGVK